MCAQSELVSSHASPAEVANPVVLRAAWEIASEDEQINFLAELAQEHGFKLLLGAWMLVDSAVRRGSH